jgi:glycosyltransferase involved in cell wall biosynthesis
MTPVARAPDDSTVPSRGKVLLFANTDWYLYNFRLSLATALREAGFEVLLVSPAGAYGDRLRSHGFRWQEAPMERRSLNVFRELALLRWLTRLIRSEGVDLVHGMTIKCAINGSLASLIASPGRGRRLARVSSIAGMGYVFTSGQWLARTLRPIVRLLMKLALSGRRSNVIVQNTDDAEFLARSGLVDEASIRVIKGSGVNCARFVPRGAYDRESTSLRVLLPARLLWDKGVAELVEAARILRGEGRKVDFLLAGTTDPGNPASVAEGIVRGWVEEGLIEWLGHVDDMPALFRTVDVVALPSYREGLPKGLIEAAACALPLVATDAPGCREVVTHEVDGLLVPVRDGVALARAIARLDDDAALRQRLGANARAKAHAQFDEVKVNQRTIEVYERVLELP